MKGPICIIELKGVLYAIQAERTASRVSDLITRLPEGEPFMGVPWEELKPGLVIEVNKDGNAQLGRESAP